MKNRFELTKIDPLERHNYSELYTPYNESDVEKSRKVDIGQSVVASCSKSDVRNLGHHKKLFALLNCTFENLPEKLSPLIKSVDDLLVEIKMQIGYKERRESIGGTVYFVPKSIAFDKLGQEAFEEFYSKTLDCICMYILPEVDRATFEQEILSFL